MKTVIEMAREAGGALSCIAEPLEHPWKFSQAELERFASLVREDEREKQQRHKVTLACPICAGTLMEDEQPFAALAARQMRDAAVKVVECEASQYAEPVWAVEIINDIAALPVPEVQATAWPELIEAAVLAEREACAKVCDQGVEFHERNAELEEDADYANRCRVYAKHIRTCARYIRAGLR